MVSRVVFVELPNTKIELLEPLGEASPIAAFLVSNPEGGMHHVCYEVEDIDAARDRLLAAGGRASWAMAGRASAPMASPCCSCIPRISGERLIELEQAYRERRLRFSGSAQAAAMPRSNSGSVSQTTRLRPPRFAA